MYMCNMYIHHNIYTDVVTNRSKFFPSGFIDLLKTFQSFAGNHFHYTPFLWLDGSDSINVLHD